MIIAESNQDKYSTQVSNGTSSIIIDTMSDKGGSGDYFRPHDLLCAGYASCLNITVRMILEKMNLKYDKVITKVDIDRDKEDSTTFLYHVEIIGDIDTFKKNAVIALASNCPVKKTLSKNIEFKASSDL
ncbi:MAG: OsmC family protein [Oscillospiraceae bacterium]|nr:OsmC family protein [Oscillospiraceae bacterium]